MQELPSLRIGQRFVSLGICRAINYIPIATEIVHKRIQKQKLCSMERHSISSCADRNHSFRAVVGKECGYCDSKKIIDANMDGTRLHIYMNRYTYIGLVNRLASFRLEFLYTESITNGNSGNNGSLHIYVTARRRHARHRKSYIYFGSR